MRILRIAGLIALAVGAAGSIGFMLYAGRHNHSRLLPVLFTFWVISPYAALLLTEFVSKRWPDFTRLILHVVMLVLTIASLAIYGYVALGPPRSKTAFVFVVVPPASWLAIAIIAALGALRSRRLSGFYFPRA